MKLTLDLPDDALAILRKQKARVAKGARADKTTLHATLTKHGFKPSAALVKFESAYGGLEIPDPDDDEVWIFGAHACLSSGAHVDPRGGSKRRGLVPVAYSPNDIIYFLDAKGAAFAQDTIEEDQATAFAKNGRELVARIARVMATPPATSAPKTTSKVDKLEALPDDLAPFASSLKVLIARREKLTALPPAFAQLVKLERLNLAECAALDVDRALPILAALPKLKDLTLPLSTSLTSVAALASSKITDLTLCGALVKHPKVLPAGLALLTKLKDLRVEYADDVDAPASAADLTALRLLFAKSFQRDDMLRACANQSQCKHLQAFARSLT